MKHSVFIAFVVPTLLIVACSEEQITVKLQPEGSCDSACGEQDLSCLEHLRVAVIDEQGKTSASSCVDLVAEQRTTCEPALEGVLQVTVPSGANWLSVAGLGPGAATGCEGPALFVGGAAFSENERIVTVTTRCTLGCERSVQSVNLQIIDFLLRDVPASVKSLKGEIGLLLDASALTGRDPAPAFEPFAASMTIAPTTDGQIELKGEIYETGGSGTSGCIAAKVNGAHPSIGCVQEFGTIPQWVLASSDAARLEELLRDAGVDPYSGYLLLRAVAEDEQPLSGVTATIPPTAQVLYGFDAELSRRSDSSSTTESGLMVVHGPFVGEIKLEAPERPERIITAGTLEAHAAAIEVTFKPGS